MQRLKISGFLGIRELSIEVRLVTVIIGEQASGKSVTARLLYYFNQYFADFDEISLAENEHKKAYDKRKKLEFYQIFPPYSWEQDDFEIEYSIDDYFVCISSKRNSTVIEITTSPSVAAYFRELKQSFRKFVESLPEEDIFSQTRTLREFQRILPELGIRRFEQSLFVPAARSFYATIRDEIFSVLALDTKIDQIILQFGEFYEAIKNRGVKLYTNPRFAGRPVRGDDDRDFFQRIVKGEFLREDGRDWIAMERGKIELNKASSGQQEAVPMLLAIARFPFPNRTLLIEEPEAHLFPDAQVAVLQYIVQQATRRNCTIFFTTHSPYMLTAMNNRLMAHTVHSENGLPIESASAYALHGGNCFDILDRQDGLISADYIDSVSESLDKEFYELVSQDD